MALPLERWTGLVKLTILIEAHQYEMYSIIAYNVSFLKNDEYHYLYFNY